MHTLDMGAQCELTALQTFLSEDQMRITAAGLFHVEMKLVPTVSVGGFFLIAITL